MEFHSSVHPYYPLSIELIDYVPNDISLPQILLIVSGLGGVILFGSFIACRQSGKSTGDSLRFMWFMLCGVLHCGFEGYWVYHRSTIASRTDLLAVLWKEYAHGDSRYLIEDELLVALETITVFLWGPLCFLTALAIWHKSPIQIIPQLLVSFAHLFSCTLYFAMDFTKGFPNCHPHPYYFWIYFVAFNSPWIIVPVFLINQSITKIAAALISSTKTMKSA
ncbi:putative EBP domain protein [Dichotomocladium elegans]|nr:putative EBP domain protein [Dichotomocladium elegans]